MGKVNYLQAVTLEPRKVLRANGKPIHTAIDALGTTFYNMEDVVKCLGVADAPNAPSNWLGEIERYVLSIVPYPAEMKHKGDFIAPFGTLLEVTRVLVDVAKDVDAPERAVFYAVINAIYANK